MECGLIPAETERAKTGKRTYAEYRIFGDLSLVLCDTCQVDFGSSDPTFFGLPPKTRVGMERPRGWQFVRVVAPVVAKDKCCLRCGFRLPFLEFVAKARTLHSLSP
jgi:hypothetical protein